MTAFAGVVALDATKPIPNAIKRDLARLVTRDASDRVQILDGPGHAVAKLDLGILDGEGHVLDKSGALSVMAGDPLLISSQEATRSRGLRALHESWKRKDVTILRGARGSFCSVHIDPVSRQVQLVSDKLGLRPVYFTVQDDLLFFSTALRILEGMPTIRCSIDLRGVSEIAAFGFPLGTRSPYLNISAIDAGEIVTWDSSGVHRSHYWRWDRLAETKLSAKDLARALYESFCDGVLRRLGTQRAVAAGLSGGLDSRAIVSCLRHLGVDVHSMNFAPLGSADLVLGRLAAEALGSRHFECPEGPLDFWERMRVMHDAWRQQLPPLGRPEQPLMLWSGDGGSCALGHIYLNEQIMDLMRRDDLDEAIEAFCTYNRTALPHKAFVRSQSEQMRKMPALGIRDEISKLDCFDGGRKLHLFLMYNSQRRLLARHYEDIDLRRVELVTPFFDMHFLELILSSPIDPFLRHRFYLEWLKLFPSNTLSVPWQAYPGHEPCPLPEPPGLRKQWDSWYTEDESKAIHREKLHGIVSDLQNPNFPGWLLDRRILQAARWLTHFRIRDYSYMFRVAREFTHYASRTAQ